MKMIQLIAKKIIQSLLFALFVFCNQFVCASSEHALEEAVEITKIEISDKNDNQKIELLEKYYQDIDGYLNQAYILIDRFFEPESTVEENKKLALDTQRLLESSKIVFEKTKTIVLSFSDIAIKLNRLNELANKLEDIEDAESSYEPFKERVEQL